MPNATEAARKDGHYWVRLKARTEGPVTVGLFTGFNNDGTLNQYPWEIIASDEIIREHEIEVISYIEQPS